MRLGQRYYLMFEFPGPKIESLAVCDRNMQSALWLQLGTTISLCVEE